MANNIINNNSGPKNITINNSTNIEPRKRYGRGGLFTLDNTSSWFGGIVDTLTSFGVLRFFFISLFLLTFVRLVFNPDARPLSFTMLLEMLNEIPQIDMNWVNNLWTQMNNSILYSNTPHELIGAVILIVNILLWIPKIILTLITGFLNIILVVGTVVGWLTSYGVSFG